MASDKDIKIGFDTNENEISLATKEITNLGNALKGSEDIAGKLLTRLSLFGIAAGVVKEIGEAVYETFKVGVDYNNQLDKTQIGLQSLISLNNNYVKSNGEVLSSVEKYKVAGGQSLEVINLLKEANRDSVLTMGDLSSAIKGTITPAMEAGLSMKQTVEFTKKMSEVSLSMGIPLKEVSGELTNMLNGTVGVNSALANNLGITDEHIQKAKEQGNLYGYLNTKISEFEKAAGGLNVTLDQSVNDLGDSFGDFMGELTEPMFNRLKERSSQLSSWLGDCFKRYTWFLA